MGEGRRSRRLRHGKTLASPQEGRTCLAGSEAVFLVHPSWRHYVPCSTGKLLFSELLSVRYLFGSPVRWSGQVTSGQLVLTFSPDFWIQVYELIAFKFFQIPYLAVHFLLSFAVQLFILTIISFRARWPGVSNTSSQCWWGKHILASLGRFVPVCMNCIGCIVSLVSL